MWHCFPQDRAGEHPRQSRGAPKAPVCFHTWVPEALRITAQLCLRRVSPFLDCSLHGAGLYVIQLHELCLTAAWQEACHVGPISHHCSDGSVTAVGSREHGASVYGFLFHRKALHILFRMNFFPDAWGMLTEFFSYQTIS